MFLGSLRRRRGSPVPEAAALSPWACSEREGRYSGEPYISSELASRYVHASATSNGLRVSDTLHCACQQAKGKQKMREPKTVMCPDWCRTGHCSSGDGCEYAHSQDELRVIDARPKYRTEPCRYWLAGKGCWYGDKCRYKQHRLAREPLYVDPFLTGTTYDRFAD
jgi:hypothetical protein